MRPIKYRVFLNNTFYFWGIEKGVQTWWLGPAPPCNTDMAELDRALLNSQEFIGRYDLDKKEVWEGDWVEWEDGIGEVFYNEETASFLHTWKEKEMPYSRPSKAFWSIIKVIGNNRQNPELAGEKT